VVLRDGRRRRADLVLACIGVTPSTELARDAGLEVRRGVVVDDLLRTSDPRIYAAGDLVEHRSRVAGLWPAAVEQAEVAAVNALGGEVAYEGTLPVTVLKVVGADLTSVGRVDPEPGDRVIAIEDPWERRYRRLVVADGRIVGGILFGWPRLSAPITAAIREGTDVSPVLDDFGAGDWSALEQQVVGAA
jgi:nitrite reductase (NADH) large subunit